MEWRDRVPAALLALSAWLGLSMTAQAQPLAALADLASVRPVMDCAALAGIDISQAVDAKVTIRSAVVKPGAAPYCEVKGEIAPRIGFETRLPINGWTQRYLQLGCGGLCGFINMRPSDCAPVNQGEIVLATTDMGHKGALFDATWGTDPQARIDFAYRGVHLTALASKALIARFYGRPPRFAYFTGCSDGGREALMEAQRFPGDFDGIVAGAPAMNFQVQNSFYHAWMALSNQGPDGRAILTAAKLPALHRAALEACDASDGLKDGQITDPRVCRFDAAAAQCRPGQAVSDDCLTAAEVGVARKLYAGPRDAAGRRFTIGGPQVGSELSWSRAFVPKTATEPANSASTAFSAIKYLVFPEILPESATLADFRFDVATFDRLAAMHPLYDATDTDLGPFARRGGKLLLWHGWSDPLISPIGTIAYYEGVEKFLGARRTRSFARLFLIPGLYHCAGGDGTTEVDVTTPLMAWVESGRAPDMIIAGRLVGGEPPDPYNPPPRQGPPAFERTRPVFAYPQVARYRGIGSIDEAANFTAAPPTIRSPGIYEWEGSRFMVPNIPRRDHHDRHANGR